MIEAPRLFGRRIAKRKLEAKAPPKLAPESSGGNGPDATGKDRTIAESNAQVVAQVLKSVLNRRRYGKGKVSA